MAESFAILFKHNRLIQKDGLLRIVKALFQDQVEGWLPKPILGDIPPITASVALAVRSRFHD